MDIITYPCHNFNHGSCGMVRGYFNTGSKTWIINYCIRSSKRLGAFYAKIGFFGGRRLTEQGGVSVIVWGRRLPKCVHQVWGGHFNVGRETRWAVRAIIQGVKDCNCATSLEYSGVHVACHLTVDRQYIHRNTNIITIIVWASINQDITLK